MEMCIIFATFAAENEILFRSERIALYIAPVGNWTLCLMAEIRCASVIRCFLPIGEREQYAVRIAQHIGGLCQTTATAI